MEVHPSKTLLFIILIEIILINITNKIKVINVFKNRVNFNGNTELEIKKLIIISIFNFKLYEVSFLNFL